MRSFTLPQANNHNLFFSQQPEVNISALASQFFNLVDPRNIKMQTQASLLTKRPNPAMMDQANLQKKLKTTTLVSNPPQSNYPLPHIANLLFSQSLENATQNQDALEQINLMRLQKLQNFSSMFNLKQQNSPQIPTPKKAEGFHLFAKASSPEKIQQAQKSFVKEEYVQAEELTTANASPLSNSCKGSAQNNINDASSEVSAEEKADFQVPAPLVEESALASYTKTFPDWDLATIFNFLKGDKPIQEFEKDRLAKMERKRGRKPAQKKVKAEGKANKTKRIQF